ncbi:MAG: DUF1190 domain-containing protein [Alphaproteobacteria bacterium]|nr:DUF1190 domain-containing protein [Alphaproteobacteria bacterium]
MKKSSSIRLVLLGSASMLLAGCGDEGPPQDAKFFSSTEECSSLYTAAECAAAKAEADRFHAAEAPRFSRKEECEAEFGPENCATQTARASEGGGSFFMPLLMGYMMGNMLSGGNRYSQPVWRGTNNQAVMPGKGGSFFGVGSFGSNAATGTSAFRPATQVASVPRGGFGSTATAYRSSAGS